VPSPVDLREGACIPTEPVSSGTADCIVVRWLLLGVDWDAATDVPVVIRTAATTTRPCANFMAVSRTCCALENCPKEVIAALNEGSGRACGRLTRGQGVAAGRGGDIPEAGFGQDTGIGPR
jgi:hypothetical protein